MSARLAAALLAELDDDALAELAAMLAPHLPQPQTAGDDDGWLDSRQASLYLGITRTALHKLTAARAIPFQQDVAGGKCWFLRSELNGWRRGGGAQASLTSVSRRTATPRARSTG